MNLTMHLCLLQRVWMCEVICHNMWCWEHRDKCTSHFNDWLFNIRKWSTKFDVLRAVNAKITVFWGVLPQKFVDSPRFYVPVAMLHRNKFLFNKTNRRTNFPNYFVKKLYMFSAVPLPIIRSFSTPDDGQRNSRKHVEFLDKINLGN